MTLFVSSGGKRIKKKAIVTTTTPSTLISVPDKAFSYTVESMSVVLKGADTDFTFSVSDGSETVAIAAQATFGTLTEWRMDNHHVPIEFGESLNFEAGAATELHVVVVALETDTSGGGRQ